MSSGAVSSTGSTVKIGSSEIVEVTGFDVDRKPEVHTYAANTTDGFQAAVVGTKRASGTVRGKYDPLDPITDHMDDGDAVTLSKYLTASKSTSYPCKIDGLSFEVDIDTGDIVGWEATWTSHLAWTDT
jgi:hypothetical protein